MALDKLMAMASTCLEYAQQLDIEGAMEMMEDGDNMIDDDIAEANDAPVREGLTEAVALTAVAVAAGAVADKLDRDKRKEGDKEEGVCMRVDTYVCVLCKALNVCVRV